MYNQSGGHGYPNSGGYPTQQQYGQPTSGIGFDNLVGGMSGQPGSYGAPPSVAGIAYAANAAMRFNSQNQPQPYTTPYGAPSQLPYGGAPAQQPYGGAPAQQPYGGAPSQQPYGGAPSQPPYGGGASQQPYAGAPSQPPYGGGASQQPYGGAPAQQPYGGAPSQQPYGGGASQQPYGGAPSQQPYGGAPSQQPYGSAPSQKPYGGSQHVNQQGSVTQHNTPPKRPVQPSSKQTGVRGQIPMEPATQGTIRDANGFDGERDSEIIRKAMKGIGTDEKAITAVLGSRSNNQRQKIKTEFATMYGKDLIKELKSELSGNYEATVLELMMPPPDYDAYQCYNAISGVGTDEKCLIEIFCSRSNTDIRSLCDAYRRMYKRELEKDICDDTSGNFRRLLVSLVQGGRLENEPVDRQKAAQDANALYQAGEARWGTDESRFNVILGSRGFPQLRLIFDEYEKISKRTLEKAIKSEMSGDLKDGMLSVVKCARNRPAFFADRLYWSMKGLGTDDKTLIRIMVSRCEVDMVQIKREFQSAYSKTLDSFIKDDCSGDYKKLLIQLCNGN